MIIDVMMTDIFTVLFSSQRFVVEHMQAVGTKSSFLSHLAKLLLRQSTCVTLCLRTYYRLSCCASAFPDFECNSCYPSIFSLESCLRLKEKWKMEMMMMMWLIKSDSLGRTLLCSRETMKKRKNSRLKPFPGFGCEFSCSCDAVDDGGDDDANENDCFLKRV